MNDVEIYYAVASHITMTAVTAITAVCFYQLVNPFLLRKKNAWTVGLTYFAMMEILFYIPWRISNFIAYSLGIFAAFLVMCVIDRRSFKQKLFLSVTFFSIRWLSLAMRNCIDKFLYYEQMRLPNFAGSQRLQFEMFLISCVLDVILSFAILKISVRMLTRAYIYKYEDISPKEMLMLSMPSISGMLEYGILKYYSEIYAKAAGSDLFDLYGVFDWLCFAHYGISLLTILVVIIMFQKVKRRQEEKKQEELLMGQYEDMKRHIGEVEKLYHDIRSLRHDMGNHVMTLENLCMKNEHDAARNYVVQLRKELLEATPEIKSGNPVTDVLLTEKKREALEKEISFQCDFHYPEGQQINAFDVCVILQNALDNAIEAADQCDNPYVHIKSYRKRNAYVMEIANSYTGELQAEGESGLLRSSKKDTKSHGFGLVNIRRMAQKYFGDIDITYDETCFVLNILLMLK